MLELKEYALALDYATQKHKGQYRIGGLPYITHPVAVAEKLYKKGYGKDYVLAGLFHDLLEDTDATEQEIELLGGKQVLQVVKLLTKRSGYVMDEYVSAIRENPIAKTVKAMDRLHNLECAIECSESFKKRYVLETIKYYMDFDEKIPIALKMLSKSMKRPVNIIEN